jgi:hypothetical protein
MAAITFDYSSDQVTTIDNTDNVYVKESELSGRVRLAHFKYTATVSVADGSQLELTRIRGARAIGGKLGSSGRTSLRAEVGFTKTKTPVDDEDAKLLGGAGTPISIAAAAVIDLAPHDGTRLVPSVELPTEEVSIFLTLDNNGGAGLQAGDVLEGYVLYTQ